MRAIVTLLTPLVLSACLPLSTYYAEGVSFAQFERDNTNCDVRALRDAPVANQVRQGAPRYIPRRICNKDGDCYSRGYWVPGDVYSVDVNANLRSRVKGQCMGDRGYRPVEIPACPQGVANAAPPGPSSTLPRLNARSCAIKTGDGRFRVVTQG
ncbi:hypothetical protein [uncultured Tateyamaria sp.]|uniref:hypothetical protein n=1 Tax=uncultured Tateyamaria sp. TaxID=455651 RepID=UPI00261CCD77|nr:hypothetical protein [uncultured Tateyamaria sp.]